MNTSVSDPASAPLPHSRKIACEFAIGLMVCGGAYFFLVNPAASELNRTRAEMTRVHQASTGTPGISSLSEAQVRDLRRFTSERAHEIARRSAPARDEAAMFTSVMDLAARHAVRINQLQPSTTTLLAQTAAPDANALPPAMDAAPTPPDPYAPPRLKDQRVAYTLNVAATYSDLAAFLNSLQHKLGYTNVKSVRCSPAGHDAPDLVQATIETEHFSFDLVGVKAEPVAPVATAPAPEGPLPE